MIKDWAGNDDEFFKNLFAYLKEKFSTELPSLQYMQTNTKVSIYHETIVALEDVHTVLRKIENDSFYKRADYEKALKGDEKKVQEIIDFYKKLAFLNKAESSFAFNGFNDHYHWDSFILKYSAFVRQSECKLYDEFKSASTWDKKSFSPDKIFGFVAAYKKFALEYEHTSESILEDISKQNELYKILIENYNELLSQNIKIGVSVFDVVLPSRLKKREDGNGYMSTDYLQDFINHLELVFSKDNGILMTINHAHIVSTNKFILSFLLIYKTKNYANPQEVFDYYNRKVSDIVGHIDRPNITLINRHEMIKKVYPDDHFIGELKSQKQKIAFREKFLRYFLSSIFLLQADKGTELEYQERRYSIFLNDFRYYKDKIYLDPARSKPKKIFEPAGYVKKKKYDLKELVDDNASKRLNKYFTLKGLSTTAIERIKLIEYLYKQQAITIMVRPSVLDELVKIECFLTRLMYSRDYHGFTSEQIRRNFEESRKLAQLPLLLQQLALLSYRGCLREGYGALINLRTDAIFFIDKFKSYFPRGLLIEDTNSIEKQLLLYKNEVLKPTFKKEKQAWRDLAKKENLINTFLLQVFDKDLKDVIAFRFIFEVGALKSKAEAKLFDEMFRDYIDNLKRRSTAGVYLLKHIGVYIPYGQSHFIDATLLFQQSDDTNPNDISDAVTKYWKNYVDNKDDQIEKYYKKDTANKTNQFDFFRNKNLRARAVCVIKTEQSLNQRYVEIFNNDRKTRRLFIERVSKFYAYCPLILVDEQDLLSFPRKSGFLILGRNRKTYAKKVEDAAENTNGNGDEQSKEAVTPDPKSLQATHMLNTDQRVVSIESDDNTLLEDENVEAELSIDGGVEEQDTIVDDSDGVLIPDKSETLVESSSQALSPVVGNSDNIQTVQTATSNKAQYLVMDPRKKPSFVKPSADQIVAEARAKEKNKDV